MTYAKTRAAIILTAAGLLSAGCGMVGKAMGPRVTGTGPVRTHARTVKAFSRIQIGLSSEVEIEVGPVAALEIDVQDNIDKIIETSVVGDQLIIDSDANFSAAGPIKVRIKTPSLEGLTILGAATIRANKFSTKSINVEINGSGDVEFEGDAQTLNVLINGAGDINLSKFKVKEASVNINGSGSVKVDAQSVLNAAITGSGEVQYSGSPIVNKKITGSGSVDRA